ncbi:MAG: hypothetical protein ACOZIN_22355 [Myxococcota bacterium]
MPVRAPSFGHESFQNLLREVYGARLTLKDGGKKGVVDPSDILILRQKSGKLVKTKLGKTRYEQAKMQLHVVSAARAFADAGVAFSHSSKTDRVNQKLWWMGYGGKMGLRQGKRPSDAVNDVFTNGHKYAMECATATLLILYKGILDRIGPKDFDEAFAKTRLFRWEIEDDDFTKAKRTGKLPGFWPGDHTYFKNPDFDPAHSAFQGENVIYLGKNEYFGHGTGILTKKELVELLNSMRRPGSSRSAFRDGFELRLDPKHIGKLDKRDD